VQEFLEPRLGFAGARILNLTAPAAGLDDPHVHIRRLSERGLDHEPDRCAGQPDLSVGAPRRARRARLI